MSRLSRANLKGRESVFAGGPEQYRGDVEAICPPNLAECVMAMEDACEEAHETQQLLYNGTYDLPRMTKVMENQKVFLLVHESTVRQYKSELTDEIEPAINELIVRAEQGLQSLYKQESALQTKVEVARTRPQRAATKGGASDKLEARRLHLLTKQRERMEQELQALETEVELLEGQMLNS